MKKKDKQPKKRSGKKAASEQPAATKLNKRIKEGEEKKIPKGYKAKISDMGAVIMLSGTSDISEKNKKKEKPAKKIKSSAPIAPKTAKQKPASKRTEPKPDETGKPVEKRKKRVVNQLKHSDREEMQESQITPVILNLGKAKPLPKVLRRVAKTGGYTAWDDVKRSGKTFATEQEAKDYAADMYKKTGKVVLVSPTDRQVTHSFKPEEKTNKK